MYNLYRNDERHLNHNVILERFKRGEISISHAFNLLTGLDDNQEGLKETTPVNVIEEKNDYQDANKLNQYLEEMDNLIGLEKVKELVKEFIAFLQVQKIRRQYGLKSQPVVLHMIFKGNPGTGKTTMARLIGKIFKELGFLENGKLIEGERADLVGEYIGHTAIKTKKLIQKALGGVLFIDEAYSLARGGEKDFGKEAIDTMVKAMEDYKDRLVIILAGYREEMDYFLESNPGLRSRFAIQLDFPDYTIDELVKIAEMMFKEREYILDKESKHYIYRVLTQMRNQDGRNNGNARTVRNLVERAIRHQARRILQQGNLNRRTLITIKKEDLAGEVILHD
ncbi:MAG: stage sporulation protein [Halanaerobiales bacterium]|nr:stage sporulation protein [Halanaerobiales bacterium]